MRQLHGESGSHRSEINFYLTRSVYLLEAGSNFGFFLMLGSTFMYVIANLQGFSSATMGQILGMMRILGFTALGLNLNTMILIVVWGLRTRHVPWWRFLFSLFSFLVGLVLSGLAVLVDVLATAPA